MRIARCSFTLQWEERDAAGNTTMSVRDQRIVEGLTLWNGASDPAKWSGTVDWRGSSSREHLKEHSVPLDKRAIAHLSNNSLGLDLYTLFAYRLPRLRQDPASPLGAAARPARQRGEADQDAGLPHQRGPARRHRRLSGRAGGGDAARAAAEAVAARGAAHHGQRHPADRAAAAEGDRRG